MLEIFIYIEIRRAFILFLECKVVMSLLNIKAHKSFTNTHTNAKHLEFNSQKNDHFHSIHCFVVQVSLILSANFYMESRTRFCMLKSIDSFSNYGYYFVRRINFLAWKLLFHCILFFWFIISMVLDSFQFFL